MISTYLNIVLAVVAILCALMLTVGIRLGRQSQRGSKTDRNALLICAALETLLIVGTMPLAAKHGSLVTLVVGCFGLALGVSLLGGLMAGRRLQKEQPIWGVPTFLTLLMVALLLGYTRHEVIKVADALNQMGIGDTQTAKIDPVADKDCPENLKSLYLAFEKYAELKGSLPPANWLEDKDLTGNIVKEEWEHCPAVSNRHDAKFGYAYNLSIAGMSLGTKEKLSQLPKASETPLLYDSTNLAKSASDKFTSLPKPGRHNGANNILYLDGTIKSVR